MNPSSWRYLLIYLHDPKRMATWQTIPQDRADDLLREVIAPRLNAQAPHLDGYYFLRYGMNGYHLRLRWKAQPQIHHILEEQLSLEISNFFAEHRDELQLTADDLDDLRASGRMQNATYEPEIAKYGGETGIEIAEAHFQVSTDISLQVLQAERDTRVKRSQFALELMDNLVKAIFTEPHEQAFWARSVAQFWLSNIVLHPSNHDIPSIVTRHAHAQQTRVYAWLWQYPEKRLEARHTQVDFQLWREHLAENLAQYQRLETQGELHSPIHRHIAQHHHLLQLYPTIQKYPLTTLVILPNYLHMLNNRLGLSALQEVQLATLYHHALNDVFHLPEDIIPLILEPEALVSNDV